MKGLGLNLRAVSLVVIGVLLFAGGYSVQGRAPKQSAALGKTETSAAKRSPEKTPTGGFDLETLERLIFDGINAERRRHGLRPFGLDSALVRVARVHSRDMAGKGYFSHDTKRGFLRNADFGDRLRDNGVAARQLAENIAMLPLVRSRQTQMSVDSAGRRRVVQVEEDRPGYSELAQWAVRQWMESPGHRKNILNPALETMGIGAAVGKKGAEDYVYLTQDFGGR